MPLANTAPLRREIETRLPERPFTIEFWDGTQVPLFGLTVSAVALGLASWAVHCYRRGSACLKIELERYERMQGLRQALGLDDPSTLLPGR